MKKFRSYIERLGKFCYFLNGKYYLDEACTRELTYNINVHFDWDNAEPFIGIFDKKGNAIYSGDVLLTNGCKTIVEWNRHECGFNIVEYGIHLCEVVSNIHYDNSLQSK